jgi:hypothetical protein
MIQKKLEFPVDFGPLGSMVIPSDLMVGKRWCKAPKDKNGRYIESGYMAAGLRDWTPGQALHWL